MTVVNSSKKVYFLIEKVKRTSGVLLSNLFIDEQKLDQWVEDRLLFYIETSEGVILLRKDRDFYHLYYNTSSTTNLSSLLQHVPPGYTLVADIIGTEKTAAQIVTLFSAASFSIKSRLDRYTRINKDDSGIYNEDPEVEGATLDYKEVITDMFANNFDKYSEQVPSLKDVEVLIREKKIIFIRDGRRVKGFLVRTINGQTSLLNNFLVDKDFRGQKLGSRLIKHYLFECKNVKRMVLWVVYNNENAISLYKQHGYVKDSLRDTIMIKN